MYQNASFNNKKDGRCIVIADCHGQPHLITNSLKDSGYDKNDDNLVFAGDILDIGYDAMKCIHILEESGAILLWGNHDLAVVINKKIWPQNMADYEAETKVVSMTNEFRVAISCNGVVITHAGISQDYYNEQIYPLLEVIKSKLGTDDIKCQPDLIVNFLNTRKLTELWVDNGPLWYRPNLMYNPPLSGICQVVGHTPPGWIKNDIENLYVVDPYCAKNFDENRFRYAIIDSNGGIEIADSNE